MIGKWEMGTGITMTKSMSRWARRDDLQGANIINSLSPFLCWADYTKDENGEIIGSEGYFQASSTSRQEYRKTCLLPPPLSTIFPSLPSTMTRML